MTLETFTDRMQSVALRMESVLDKLLPAPEGDAALLQETMRYAVLGGGKRLRPFLLVETARMLETDENDGIWYAAAALECLHTYSLAHDDLPCMDDDDTRRGKPSVHKQYDEAIGVLTGDALLTFAFELLSQPPVPADPLIRLKLIQDLAKAAGSHGMIGGQVIDMAGTAKTESDITRLQERKTGALIEYSVMAGAALGGADHIQMDALRGYARDIGLAFQIKDDILDHEGDAAQLGKAARKDAGLGKTTFVSILGLEAARDKANMLGRDAKRRLEPFEDKGKILQEAVDFIINRDR